jgi:hypothetical protein
MLILVGEKDEREQNAIFDKGGIDRIVKGSDIKDNALAQLDDFLGLLRVDLLHFRGLLPMFGFHRIIKTTPLRYTSGKPVDVFVPSVDRKPCRP